MTKPFSFAVLSARLRALHRRPPMLAANLLRFNELELDLDRCTFRVGGQTVNLTRTEFRLLETMMRHPERVHRREALIERVWGYDCNVESNTLDVFICQLRNKIGVDRGDHAIQTVRGLGYKLSPKAA